MMGSVTSLMVTEPLCERDFNLDLQRHIVVVVNGRGHLDIYAHVDGTGTGY